MDHALQLGEANIDVFADALLELARRDRDVLAVTSDSRGSAKLRFFGEALPEQLVEVGIAEQNLVGIAAGLASTGKKVFAVSPASFLTARALEQIKNDVAYSDNPVKLVGISAGVSYGPLGSTHHSLHDLAALRAINNIDIVVPADNFETREAVRAAVVHTRPVYLRFGKRPVYNLHSSGATFEMGRSITILSGDDVTFIAIGETVHFAYLATRRLRDDGISCRVMSMHTLRPFDTESVLNAARNTRALITVEEHSIHGGLGEACASALLQNGLAVPFRIVGIPDEYTVVGSQLDILTHYGISADGLVEMARGLLCSE